MRNQANNEVALDFESYYKSMGFISYPFSVYTAESELEKAEDLYKKPSNYSVINEALDGSSVIVIGERGTGKTALNLDIMRKKQSVDRLFVSIDDFSALEEGFSSELLYEFITSQIAAAFFKKMSVKPKLFWKYSKDERLYLSLYLYRYVPASTKNQLREQIKKIQHGRLKRLGFVTYNSVRVVLNYGLKALTKAISDSLTKHFSALPEIDFGDSEYFKRLDIEVDESFTSEDKAYYFLEKLCDLVRKSGFNEIIISMDKIDEDSRFKNDAERISNFIELIASNHKVIINDRFKIILFIWSAPFNMIKSGIRTQKIVLQQLSWRESELKDVAAKRISAFSDGQLKTLHDLFDENADDCVKNIIFMTNDNPRDLWHILNNLFISQFEIDSSRKITMEAMSQGIEKFVKQFNYYEYYPRRASARANSMDIYSYIKHLMKLNSNEFTKSKLNEMAGTGSSTGNYVVSMENMGLIRKTVRKEQGGVVYEIKDPKVRYAREYGIEISL
ncbi:hypothetical protein QMU90_002733 [Edwardsiella ictaluri]|uniref:ATP-binding protein n=2 Tax=Edwardsiella ictaluri TaxID=67780 RepID=A0ABY8GFB7_EDWIC|nr:hypothetical protein [Edwardsiella ictaluri]ELV7528848.1 hypothetical protein [Edwardsiella ictaluri]KMQ77878.1 hypothetical protein ABY58_11920 [Edwardsiella ictaluri]WFN96160.1 hypothetical protein MAY91_15435 [Edwardsiella ictaluri]